MKLTKKEVDQLNAAKTEIKLVWEAACFMEGVPTDSKFVIFSDANNAAREHNQKMIDFGKLRARIIRNVEARERRAQSKQLASWGVSNPIKVAR